MSKIKALNDNVIGIESDQGKDLKKFGNITIPDNGNDRPLIVEIVSMGGEVYSHTEIQPGDLIVLPKVGSWRFTIEGTEYISISYKNILCKLNKDK